jgi:hypothetical protein
MNSSLSHHRRCPRAERAAGFARGGRADPAGPQEVNEQMQTGAFGDPAGNVFGVYQSER